jgi:hypothetical protein
MKDEEAQTQVGDSHWLLLAAVAAAALVMPATTVLRFLRERERVSGPQKARARARALARAFSEECSEEAPIQSDDDSMPILAEGRIRPRLAS